MENCCGGNEIKKAVSDCGCESLSCETKIKIDRYLRGIAGVMVLLSVSLTHYHSPNWIWFTVFIGLNLFQSAFTKWCPMITVLQKIFKK